MMKKRYWKIHRHRPCTVRNFQLVVKFFSRYWYLGCALRKGMKGSLITSWSLGLFLYILNHLSPFQVTPNSIPKNTLLLNINVDQVPISASLIGQDHGGCPLYVQKKKESKYNCKNIYTVVEKQSSIKGKKQKHSPLPPRNIDSLSPEISFFHM